MSAANYCVDCGTAFNEQFRAKTCPHDIIPTTAPLQTGTSARSALEEAERFIVEELEKRMSRDKCSTCRGKGFTEAHIPGFTHYETDADEECPSYHYRKSPCPACGDRATASIKPAEDVLLMVRDALRELPR